MYDPNEEASWLYSTLRAEEACGNILYSGSIDGDYALNVFGNSLV
jgi:hypothetical protein